MITYPCGCIVKIIDKKYSRSPNYGDYERLYYCKEHEKAIKEEKKALKLARLKQRPNWKCKKCKHVVHGGSWPCGHEGCSCQCERPNITFKP